MEDWCQTMLSYMAVPQGLSLVMPEDSEQMGPGSQALQDDSKLTRPASPCLHSMLCLTGAACNPEHHQTGYAPGSDGHVPAMPMGYKGMNMVYRSQVSQAGGCPSVFARYQGYLHCHFT